MLTNEFRILDTELLAGESNFVTEMVEKGITYKLDFSKVFWNSRLNTVHDKIVQKFSSSSVVFDVFSGIGPFVLPALKLRHVKKAYANDLNPSCITYMKENVHLNKISESRIEMYNLDGKDFIRTIIPKNFIKHCNEALSECSSLNFHVVMNLPGLSVQFLSHFNSFLCNFPEAREFMSKFPIWVHCHFFVKADEDCPSEWFRERARLMIREKLEIPDLHINELRFTRKVAGRKEMYCATFLLPSDFAYPLKTYS